MNKSHTKKCIHYNDYTNDFIYEYPGVLTSLECDMIIQLANKKGLSQDRLLDGKYVQSHEPEYNPLLTYQVWLTTSEPLINKLNDKISKLIHRSLEKQPPFEIIQYTPSTSETSPHHDAYEPNELHHIKQRFATMVVYLNDDYIGGETYFPLLNKTIYPEKGKVLFFYNVNNHKQTIRKTSLHQSYSIKQGEKWVAHRCITL